VYDYALGKDLDFATIIPNNSFVYPIYFESLEANPRILTDKHQSQARRFVVQGTINYDNRDYGGLIEATSQLARQVSSSELEVLIIGSGQDRNRLVDEIESKQLGGFFKFPSDSSQKLAYKEYYDAILSSDFLLPLISDPNANYLNCKMSSSLMMVLGMKTIPIISAIVANTYGIDHIKYYDNKLASGLMQALKLDYSDYLRLQLQLRAKSLQFLQQSIDNMEAALEIILRR
jgi:hypothetical protein